jgi:hypothetical protein
MARIKYDTIKELEKDYQNGEFNFEDLLKTFETSIIDVSTEQKEEILEFIRSEITDINLNYTNHLDEELFIISTNKPIAMKEEVTITVLQNFEIPIRTYRIQM